MKIPLKEAYSILEQCSAIVLPEEYGQPVIYPSLGGLADSQPPGSDLEQNEFMMLKWDDGELHDWAAYFHDSDNLEVEKNGSSLTFIESENGEEIVIMPLAPFLK